MAKVVTCLPAFRLLLLLSAAVSLSNQFPGGRAPFDLALRQKRDAVACPAGAVPRATGMRAFLTVSSLASTSDVLETVQRQIELNWFNDAVQDGDWVGLFDHDPTVNPTNPLQRVVATDHPGGYYRTTTMYPRPDLRKISLERQCLGYWIGYIRSGSTIAMDCLKAQPTWMHDMRGDIGHLRLRELMVPGTHDSGSYAEYRGRGSEDIFTRWVITQDEPFWEQLVYGIRAFDLRMGYYSETPVVFWLNHNFIKVNPFRDAVEDLKRFLNQTQEIVLLDFHMFPVGYTNRMERHAQLLEYVLQELGEYMLDRSVHYDVTLDAMWRSGKRLVVAYSDKSYANSGLLWSGISQSWANTKQVDALFGFFLGVMAERHSEFWAAMAELTPGAFDVIMSNSSLRIYADSVNRNVTMWFRNIWWNSANVVSVDFFLGTNIVDVSIESNLKRKLCRDGSQLAMAQRAQAMDQQSSEMQPPVYMGPRAVS